MKDPFDPKDPINLDDNTPWLEISGEKADHPWFFVVSTYGRSPARGKTLVQVHSRRMRSRFDAESFKRVVEMQHLKKNKGKHHGKHFTVIEVPHYQWQLFS